MDLGDRSQDGPSNLAPPRAQRPGVNADPPAIIDGAGNEIGKTGDLIVSGCYDLVQNAYQIDGSDLRASGG